MSHVCIEVSPFYGGFFLPARLFYLLSLLENSPKVFPLWVSSLSFLRSDGHLEDMYVLHAKGFLCEFFYLNRVIHLQYLEWKEYSTQRGFSFPVRFLLSQGISLFFLVSNYVSRPVNGKTVEIRLIIFRARTLQIFTQIYNYTLADFSSARSRVDGLHICFILFQPAHIFWVHYTHRQESSYTFLSQNAVLLLDFFPILD